MQLFGTFIHLYKSNPNNNTMKKLIPAFSLLLALCFSAAVAHSQVAKRNDNLGNFTALEISSAFEVELVQGNTPGVALEVDERYIDQVHTEIKGDKLRLYTKGTIKNPKKMKAIITFTDLESLQLSGATKVSAAGSLNFRDLVINASGATKMDIELQADKLRLNTTGASNIALAGQANAFAIDLSGASKLNAYKLKVGDGSIKVAGASKADVYFSGRLDVNASGASKVNYRGGATLGKVNTSGASKVSGS